MTPPRVPGHESDDIVDMTPTQDSPPGDLDEIVELTPQAPPADASADLQNAPPLPDAFNSNGTRFDSNGAITPYSEEYSGHDVVVNAEDTDSTWDSLDRVPEYYEPEPVDNAARGRVAGNGSTPGARPPAPPRPRPPQPSSQPSPKPNPLPAPMTKESLTEMLRRHWKLGGAALAALVIITMLVKVVAPFGGSVGGDQGTQATTTATIGPAQIGTQPITSSVGPLLLLNPGVVKQGSQVSVTASGFDPSSAVDLVITRQGAATALATTHTKADKSGMVISTITVPTSLSSGTFVVTAKQINSKNSAQGVGTVAGGSPTIKLNKQVGQPGTPIVITLHGFAPRETVNVYWNTMSGEPVAKLTTDGGGGVGQAPLRVPFGAVGDNTFLFVGQTSQSVAATDFLVLRLYPTVKLTTYSLQADHVLSYSGSGFGPGERVFVFAGNVDTPPLAVIQTDQNGAFKNAPGFVIPFSLKGKQTLVFMGEQSRTPNSVSFTVQPYAPQVEPSTYGGFPGTTITFFATGFAHNEVVHVYVVRNKGEKGNMVACFQTDGKGNAGGVGSYLIPGDTQGTVGFTLVGAKSGGVGNASVKISAPPTPIQTPPQPPFTCPLDSQAQQAPAPQVPAMPAAPPPDQQPAGQPGQ